MIHACYLTKGRRADKIWKCEACDFTTTNMDRVIEHVTKNQFKVDVSQRQTTSVVMK